MEESRVCRYGGVCSLSYFAVALDCGSPRCLPELSLRDFAGAGQNLRSVRTRLAGHDGCTLPRSCNVRQADLERMRLNVELCALRERQ